MSDSDGDMLVMPWPLPDGAGGQIVLLAEIAIAVIEARKLKGFGVWRIDDRGGCLDERAECIETVSVCLQFLLSPSWQILTASADSQILHMELRTHTGLLTLVLDDLDGGVHGSSTMKLCPSVN